MKDQPSSRWIWLIACAFISVTAHAELALTNYSAAHPLKVLASGDSITDDSSTNGAWRAHLAALLAAKGYVFTNLGRWTSSSSPGFTQRHHEGMDGAVIASPGLSGPTHGYTAANNYALRSLADALTNATPDLVLIDLGVNDMGRGREPYHAATNDLSALLDVIFAKLPSAHIIVSKPTTITYATILSPPYNTYRANMLAFCDAVQGLAAARRAQGQKVFVADLFSKVYGPAMLKSDGTHPNPAGMSAIADEMMFRIAAITTRPDSALTPFIFGGSAWKYSDQGLDLGTNWSRPEFDDSAWASGAGRLGYNVAGITSPVNYGTATNKYITTYFRHAFAVPNNVIYTNLGVRLNRMDGAVVWLNGQELYRVNLPAGPIDYQTTATTSVSQTGDDSNTYFPTNLPIASLPAGTNVIAVELHRYSPTGVGMTFDLELFGDGMYAPTLSYARAPDVLRLKWPTNYTAFSLQTATNLGDMWQLLPGPYPLTNNSFEVAIPIDTNAPQFFRLASPY